MRIAAAAAAAAASMIPNWNLMIKNASSNFKVFSHFNEMKNHSVLSCILKACSNTSLSFRFGTSIHACLIKQGFYFFTSIANSTLDFYLKTASLNSALNVFDEIPHRDSVSWNIIIHAHLHHQQQQQQGLCFFSRARRSIHDFVPNVSTLVLLIHSFRNFGHVNQGYMLHNYIVRNGFLAAVSIQNSLLSFYSDISMGDATNLFNEIFNKDLITWSSMISAYVRNHQVLEALHMFIVMISEEMIQPDAVTIVSVLNASKNLIDIKIGKSLHVFIICRGFNHDVFVGNALIDMYSKFKDVASSNKVFNDMSHKNNVSWNSILSGFVQNGKHLEALSLFELMCQEGIEKDEVTVVNLVQICKYFTDSLNCKSVHAQVIRRSYDSNELVMNSLMDTYAKCNLVEFSWKLFNSNRRERDMVSWSTMMSGFNHCGMPDKAISVFNEMKQINSITILGLLESCSILADLNRSKWAHCIAIRRVIWEQVQVGTAIVVMYAKCGAVEASRKVFDLIEEKNVVSWSAMISAYGMNGLTNDALALVPEMERHGLKPNEVTLLSLISACGHGGFVEKGLSIFKEMVRDYDIEPKSEHYSCIVDMLGRAGKLNYAINLINNMPDELLINSATIWGSLLSACATYKNIELGEEVVARVLELDSAGYFPASSMYAANGLWEDAGRMRCLAKEKRVRIVAGYSWVHVKNKAHRFVAGDEFHEEAQDIYTCVEYLHACFNHILDKALVSFDYDL